MTYLKGFGVTQSFSRPHVPYDNSVMESFFSNMKREELYRTKYRSEKELRAAVDAYIKFYNGERPHSKNQYKTPDRKEAEYFSKQAKNRDCYFGIAGFGFHTFFCLEPVFSLF
jgi:transposase InsO family protein